MKFFTEHKFIFVCAILLAFLILLPSWMFPFMAGDAYNGINLGEWDDDAAYIARGREILEGHSLGNTFLKIGKNDSSDPHQTYIDYLLLAPVKLLGLSGVAKNHIVVLYGFYTFLGVALLVLFIYFFILHLSDNKLLSAAAALFTVGGYELVKLYHLPVTAVAYNFNIFSRPIMPVYGLLALFIYINLLAKSLRESGWRRVFWAGISFGALFYVYPFTWTFAAALTGSLFLIYICLRDWESAKKVFWVSAIGLAIGSYALVLLALLMSSEIGKQIAGFTTFISHAPAPFSKLSFLILIMAIIYAFRNRGKKDYPILLAIILASWIALNQQVITGRDPQGVDHYFWYFTIPTSIVVGSYVSWALVWGAERGKLILRKYGSALLGIVIVIAFLNTASRQYARMLVIWDAKEYAQNYRPIIDALNRDTAPGVILSSDLFYGRFFSVYTDHDLFWAMHAFNFATPAERMKDALYVYAYLDKEARGDFAGALYKIDAGGIKKAYGRHYSSIYAALSREKTIDLLSGEYKKIVDDPEGIINILKKADVNYIVWDKNTNPEWDLSPLADKLQEIAASNNIYLYALK
ncbi:hypothetical protein A2661_00580 [Candidatus Giovannonibacteria bacterium RIFCSPHIGHO2_01_FULL_45_24]|uniref:Glycosyltransferase RgtA/B/C/D-like domain-containing protein n=1 Tax=Candidatus Giovannonibacteria bacterium RIFCSPLOWO2_01_FULL_46_32 TaxID=1798353 RepID=A0A1F5XGK5_9BACT|nr:MAG: hypothetical protein A2661_00580 [Candidatus Giovannonibacteria bacterium RIFCSPHIGHO2_01_FULL_45_24]OGF87072.1 MAG: hypothetical protein A3B19_01420 [Candidatus Giovannonibacteria bacterium RIFCSPLOWO2_01_FULL_46_32]